MSFTIFLYIMLQVTLLQSHWDLTLAGERVNATESSRFSHELMMQHLIPTQSTVCGLR